jgi:hypothetical protein
MLNQFKKAMQVIAIATVTTISFAQPGGRGFSSYMTAGGMTPDYMLRDLQRFVVAFDLTEEQSMIVEQILRDYDESFKEASDASQEGIGDSFRSMRGTGEDTSRERSRELRERSGEIRDKLNAARSLGEDADTKELQDRLNKELDEIRTEINAQRLEQWQSPERQAAFEEMALLVQDQLRLKRQMRDEFEGDLVEVLSEEQAKLWPALQRQLIRDRLLPRGRLSGESLDVMGLVEQQDYEDDVLLNILPALNEWDVNVTASLVARDDYLVSNQGTLMASMRSMDTSSGIDVLKMQGKLSEEVRFVNDSAVVNIVLLLPENEKNKFDAIAKLQSYPRIYRASRVDRAYEAALELEGLEPEILQAIMDLQDNMDSEFIYANENLLSATHEWESQEQIERMNRFAQRMMGGSNERTENPIQIAEAAKQTIEDNYLELLRGLLTEEQIKELGGLEKRNPRESRQRDRGRNRGAGQDNRGGSGGFGGGREEFMNRFDKDGNGEISEEERQAIRDYFRNGGGQRGGGSDGGGRP